MMILAAMLLTAAPAVCSLGSKWQTQPSHDPQRQRNIVRWSDGSLTFNGARVSDAVLASYFAATSRLTPGPEIVVDTSSVDCARQKRIASMPEAAASCTPATCLAFDLPQGPPPPASPMGSVTRRR